MVTLTAVALLMGIGNGLGAGVIMTLGADASPPVGRAQFLGAFRLFADTGNGAGPFLIAAVTALAGLAPAVLFMGAHRLGSRHRHEPLDPTAPGRRPESAERLVPAPEIPPPGGVGVGRAAAEYGGPKFCQRGEGGA